MPAIEVWLDGGPADGRLMPVELTVDGRLPEFVHLRQSGMFVGSEDQPMADVEHQYRREADIDEVPVYRYTPAPLWEP
jgi:hypothetical protein